MGMVLKRHSTKRSSIIKSVYKLVAFVECLLSFIPMWVHPHKAMPSTRFKLLHKSIWQLVNAATLMASISRGLRWISLLWSFLLVVTVITSRLITKFCNSQDFVYTSGFLLSQSTFSELLDLLALVGIATIVVRYLHLEMVTHGLQGEAHSRVSSLRVASLAFGIGSMLGITLISNFRQPNQQVS